MRKGLTRSIPYPLAAALGMSLLLHLALLSIRLHQPLAQDRQVAVLQVKLEKIRRMAETSQAPAAPPPRPEQASAKPSTTLPPKPTQPATESAPEPRASTTDTLSLAQQTEAPRSADMVPTAPVAQQPARPEGPEQPVRRATITYAVSGTNVNDTGQRLVQEYIANEEGRYRINIRSMDANQVDTPQHGHTNDNEANDADTKDDASPDLEIVGRIGERGLVAETYSVNDDSLARQLMQGGSDGQSSEPGQGRMSDGILDRFSVLYQFMFSGEPLDRDHLSLTDGKQVIPYTYTDVGPERIKLTAGREVLTQHHRFTSMQSPSSLDVWIAPQMRRLPVRARFTDADGAVTELTATDVRSED